MKLIFLLLLLPVMALAQTTNSDLQYVSGLNLLVNPSFEQGKKGWTNASGTFAITKVSGEVSELTSAAKITLSTQTLNFSQTVPTKSGIQKQGFVKGLYKVPSGITNFQVCSIVDSVEQTCVPSGNLIADNTYRSIEIPLTFGTTNAGIKFKTGGNVSGDFFFDTAVLGQGLGTISLNGAQWVGSIDYGRALNCGFDAGTGNTSYVAYPADADCSLPVASGDIRATGLKKPEFILNQKTNGTYYFVTTAVILSNGASVKAFRLFNVTDSTQVGEAMTGSFSDGPITNFSTSYRATTSGLKTLEFQHKAGGSNSLIIYSDGSNANASLDRQFKVDVYFYPDNSVDTYTASNANYEPVTFTPTVANIGSPVLTNTCKHWRDGGYLNVSCSFPVGTVAASLFSFTLPNSLQLDASKIPSANTTSGTGSVVGRYSQNTTGGYGHVLANTGSSTTLLYIGGQGSQSAQLTPQTSASVLLNGTQTDINFSVPILGWSNAPFIIGSFQGYNSTPGLNNPKVYSAKISFSGAVSNEKGNFIDGNCSESSNLYTCNFVSGVFTSTPNCFTTTNEVSATQVREHSASSSQLTFFGFVTTSGTGNTVGYNLLCHGE